MTTEETPEEQTDEHPAQSGSSSTDVKVPFAPHEDDDSEMGDTDQHSDA